MVWNRTDLDTNAVHALALQAAELLKTKPVNVEVIAREGQRANVKFVYRILGGETKVTLYIRKQTHKKPYDDIFLRSFAANLRAGTARCRKKRGRAHYWAGTPAGLVLWKPLDALPAPQPKPSRRALNEAKTRKALDRCNAALLVTEKRLKALRKRAVVLTKKVLYYERLPVTKGPEFDAKLKELVKEKWGAEEAPQEKAPEENTETPADELWGGKDYRDECS